jgi:hypothetical protein
MALVTLYRAPDELMANSVRDLLEQNGVPAALHSFQIPAYDGIARMMRPVWGEVLVEEADRDRAQELLDDFLASARDVPDDDDPPADD